MNPKVEIFSQGQELVTGQVIDTNAAWLSEQLIQMGFNVTRHTTVGDILDDLVNLLQEIANRADCCICTGGLGPTVDDLTAEAVAIAFDLPLEFDAVAYQQMADYFKSRGRSMPKSNRKQAMLPKGSIRLDNEWGTAPGFALKAGRCHFAFVPGVPYEMKQMFEQRITPAVLSQFSTRPWKLMTIKTLGMGESELQNCLEKLDFPESVQLGFRTGKDEIQTKLLFPPEFPEAQVQHFTSKVAKQLGESVFTIVDKNNHSEDIAAVIEQLLLGKQQTFSILETFSHGLMSAKCLPMATLIESLFIANVEMTCKKMGIEIQEDLETLSAKISRIYRNKTAVDYALVQMYSASKTDISNPKQSIRLYNAIANNKEAVTCVGRATGTLKRKQNQAALSGLDFLRRYLQKIN